MLFGSLGALLERSVELLGALLRRFGSLRVPQGTLGASLGALGGSFWTSRGLLLELLFPLFFEVRFETPAGDPYFQESAVLPR